MALNFSIIIPHKNIPHLLERCLASIPKRDDIQIIVVDDEFGRGAGYARNLGLERAQGKWLIFADADDFFNPDFEKALEKYVDHEADMICFSSNSVSSDNVSTPLKNEWYAMGERIKTAIEQNNLDIIRYDTGVVWARFIKRNLVEKTGVRFQETMVRNDTFFAVQIGCAARNIVLNDTLEIYCYARRDNSIMSRETAADKKERYLVSKTVMRYLRKQKKGGALFNNDLLHYWSSLKDIDTILYIKEFPAVFWLSSAKKRVAANFGKSVISIIKQK